MCWRWIPSKVAPIASIARASARSARRSSARRGGSPTPSKACSSMSSFASTLTPVCHASGCSHVQPISTDRCSGPQREDSASSRATRPSARGAIVTSGQLACPAPAASSAASSQRVELGPGLRLQDRQPASTCAGRATPPRDPSSWRRVSGSRRTMPALERRCDPRLHAAEHYTAERCRSTSTRAWSARSTSRSSSAATTRSSRCPTCGAAKVLKQLSVVRRRTAPAQAPSFTGPSRRWRLLRRRLRLRPLTARAPRTSGCGPARRRRLGLPRWTVRDRADAFARPRGRDRVVRALRARRRAARRSCSAPVIPTPS